MGVIFSIHGDIPVNRFALRCLIAAFGFAVTLASVNLSAQEPGNVPETKAPPPTQTAPPKHPDNDYWRKHDAQLLTDFPWLARFKEDDLKLGPPAAGENRVVFMGDSITEGWSSTDRHPLSPANPISIAASAAKPLRKWSSGSTRM